MRYPMLWPAVVLACLGLLIAEAYCPANAGSHGSRRTKTVLALAPISPRIVLPSSSALKPAVTGPARTARPEACLMKHGDKRVRAIMLTFDDGPHPRYTPRILAVLRKYHVKATFFVVGKMAAKHPELVRAIAADGHLVANHTYDHVRLTLVPEREDVVELRECSDVIQNITGKRPAFCRPPGCRMNAQVLDAASSQGLRVVFYTVNTFDTIDHNKHTVAARVVRDVRNGGIVLCHDGFQQTIDALPRIITGLRKKGYVFETVAGATE